MTFVLWFAICFNFSFGFILKAVSVYYGSAASRFIILGSAHTDLLGLTGAKKAFNSCEDLHDGFRAILKGKDHHMCKALVSASINSIFMSRSQMCTFFFTRIELSKPTPVRRNRSVCSDPYDTFDARVEKHADLVFLAIVPTSFQGKN